MSLALRTEPACEAAQAGVHALLPGGEHPALGVDELQRPVDVCESGAQSRRS